MRTIDNTNYIKLNGNNILFQKDKNSYIVHLKEYNEIICVDYWESEDSFVVRKWEMNSNNTKFEKNGTYLTRQYQDWVFPRYFDKHKDDCLFDSLEHVLIHLNKFLYELY